MGTSLSAVVSISRQFLRSVRIDTDIGREDALTGYVCQGTALSLLESMARQIVDTKQRAFTWTGPYGGGKSSLALMLSSLVGPNPKLRAKAKSILALPENSPVHRAFEAKGEGWLVVPVVGKRGSVIAEISRSLAQASGLSTPRRKALDIVADLVAAAEQQRHGLLLVIDELGKFLEASAQDGDDIYFFQQLAEAASRIDGKLVIVGILHQAFDAYASRLGRQARDDWSKIQGRFVDIPLVAGTDEVIELIGSAITVDASVDQRKALECVDVIARAIRARRPGTPGDIAAGLARCWPLHPVTAALLGPISRRRFGQNERSTFGFLASREPVGFVEFLEGAPVAGESMYGPARYWDYLRANLEQAILASPDGHRWSVVAEAVERAEAKGDPLHVELTKAVSLIEMFRNGSGLVAEEAVLGVCLQGAVPARVHTALKDLVEWRILIERKHLGAYGVYAGSDFDIEAAVKQARGEIESIDMGKVSALTDLQPILAKRLYQETGTMRWFTRRIIQLDEAGDVLARFKPDRGSVGAFCLCLPGQDRRPRHVDKIVGGLSQEYAEVPVLLGVPANAERISELTFELSSSERVLRTRPELEGDSVGRRELIGRIASVRAALEEELSDAFSLSRWYYQGVVQSKERVASLSAIASAIARTKYPDTPHLFSELINREAPSSNSNKARKDLMYRMVKNAVEERLGYDGYPADAGLYHTVLAAPGLHRQREEGSWGFGPPNSSARGKSMETFWYATRTRVFDADRTFLLSDIYAEWAQPPYGIRTGVMPVLALAFYLAHSSELAMYLDGTFTPHMSDAAVDEWLVDPAQVRFKYVSNAGLKGDLAAAIAKSVGEQVSMQVGHAPLDAAKSLVSLTLELPGWTKRTTTVSQVAQDVRAMLLKASDPHKVLFADLPTLLQARETAELVAKLRVVTEELTGAYGKMLQRVSTLLLSALDHTDRPLALLRERAAGIKRMTGDFLLEAFAARLEVFNGSPESIEGLISLGVSKPSSGWVDADINAALQKLIPWALDFRRAEAMAPLQGRPSMRRVIGVVFGASQGLDVSGSVDIAEADMPAVDRLVKRLLMDTRNEREKIVLAALAELGASLMNRNNKQEAA